MSRGLRYFLECETWNVFDSGTSRRDYRRWFTTHAEAEAAYAKIRRQLQADFKNRFVELRIVAK